MKKLLVVVDYQNDFVSGALGFPGAEKLEAGIVHQVEATLAEGGQVLFTRDTHEADYLQTREGIHLPIPHCVEGSTGHQLYGKLHTYEEHRVPGTMLLDKPTFGCVDIGKKAAGLCGGAPDVIELCGLVTDICVIANAILLHSYFPKAQMRVLAALCGSGNAAGAQGALDIMRGMGMEIVP
ncbi:MAG: cysteine hydrolase [Ruminococcaceae bacterium]|nr:cysteine hydrolase [Oscillospiraceae bacterium]